MPIGGSARWHAWISRLESGIGWMFWITYWLVVCLVPGCCKVFGEGSLEVFILSKRGHPGQAVLIMERHKESREGMLPKGMGQNFAQNRPSV